MNFDNLKTLNKDEYINALNAMINHPEASSWIKPSYFSFLILAVGSLKREQVKRDMEMIEAKRLDDLAMKTFKLEDGSTLTKQKTSLGIEYKLTQGE